MCTPWRTAINLSLLYDLYNLSRHYRRLSFGQSQREPCGIGRPVAAAGRQGPRTVDSNEQQQSVYYVIFLQLIIIVVRKHNMRSPVCHTRTITLLYERRRTSYQRLKAYRS